MSSTPEVRPKIVLGMTKKINYEDDIFALSLLLRGVSDIVKLDIDADFFAERVDGDIRFIDSAMRRVFESISSGPFFLKRQDYLKDMLRLKNSFVDLLDSLAENRVAFAETLSRSTARYHDMGAVNQREISDIRSSLSESSGLEEEHMVSEDEYKILLSPTDETS
jgi:hypothetical protein